MAWTQAAAAALPVIMSLIGEAQAAGDDARADELRRQAMEEYNIGLPELQALEAKAVTSQAAQAQGNPAAKAMRMEALRSLSQRGAEGYNAEDRAAISDTLSEVNQNERGQREAMMRQVDPNSGAALALQAGNQQAAAQRAHSQGLQVAAGSRAQALKALAMGGQMAGDMDADEFGQSMARGQAGDAISKFNEANRLDTQRANNQNAMARFGGQLQLAQGRTGVKNAYADTKNKAAARTRGTFAQIGQGGQQIAYGLADDEEDGQKKPGGR